MDSSTVSFIKDTIFSSSQNTIGEIIKFWPNILGALGVVIIGYAVAVLVEKFVIKGSNKLRLGWVSEKIGLGRLLEKAEIKRHPAEMIGKVMKGYIFTMFFIGACNIVKLVQIANFLEAIIAYIPKLVVALIIVLFGVQISDTVGAVIKAALHFATPYTAEILANVAKYTLVFFSILAALVKLNIADTLVEILFVGFVSMMALAGGLALGLGGKDMAREFLESLKELEKKKAQARKKKTEIKKK